MSDLLIGLDVGTQSAKAGLFQVDGTCLAEAALPLELRRRGADEVEQDADEFYTAALRTIRACLETSRVDAQRVAAVGVAGQMAGVLGIGADGLAVTPYDSWLDSRCRSEVEEIAGRLGDEGVERTGCQPMVAHAPKLLWWRRRRPDVYARIAKFVVPSAYVAGRLCGLDAEAAFVDRTHLHFTGLADAADASWSQALVDELGLELDRLPRIVAPTEHVGLLRADAAGECGLAAGTPVAAGLGDTAAGLLGAGVVRPGQVLDTAGTAAVLAVSTASYRPDVAGRTLITMHGAIEGQWVSLAYLAGGDLLRWLPQAVDGAPAGDPSSLERLLAEAEATSPAHGPFFVPHVGGRILPSAPAARGAWTELEYDHARGDLVRSVLESVAFEYAGFLERVAELFPDLVPHAVRVIGGGSRDAFWNRIKAAVLGLPYVRLVERSFSCYGAALVAGACAGVVPDLARAASSAATESERFLPDAALHERYASQLHAYREARDRVAAAREEVLV